MIMSSAKSEISKVFEMGSNVMLSGKWMTADTPLPGWKDHWPRVPSIVETR
jgi:hypothetical protein